MSYGASLTGITQSYKDDPELRRRIEQMRAEQARMEGASYPEISQGMVREIPELTGSQARGGLLMPWDPEAADPNRPYFWGEAAKSAYSGATLPEDVRQGKVDPGSEEGFARVMDLAGLANTGGLAGAPAGGTVLGLGPARQVAGSGATARAGKIPKIGDNSRYQYANPARAESYPELGTPITKLKDEPPKGQFGPFTYLGKGESVESKAFMKDRAKIRKEMQTEGYEPYFDPAKRADVDPANYPTDVNTVTDVVGKQAKTQATHEAVSHSPAALQRLREAYEHGETLGGGGNWYYMKQLEDAFIKELGETEGRAAFRDKFAGQMAATTGGSAPEDNFLAAMFANYERNKGRDVPERGYEIPSPIGGRYLKGNMEQANKYAAEGLGEFTVQNPKRHNFQFNFLGHRNKATIDEQMSNLIDPKLKGMPPSGNYGSYEKAVHTLAAEYGVDPRYFQEVAWAGGKAMKDKGYKPHPMIQTVNDSIERTSRLTGLSPAEVVRRGIVRSEMPMYTNKAGGVGAAILGEEDEEAPMQLHGIKPRKR